jgi:hypothetical protein
LISHFKLLSFELFKYLKQDAKRVALLLALIHCYQGIDVLGQGGVHGLFISLNKRDLGNVPHQGEIRIENSDFFIFIPGIRFDGIISGITESISKQNHRSPAKK